MQAGTIIRVGGTPEDFLTLQTALRGIAANDVRHCSASDAVEMIAGRRADLVVLDVSLPSADVFAVLRAAQPSDGRAVRVPVIVTGPVGTNDRIAACLQRGAEDYMHVPFDAENAVMLTRRIELSLNRRHLREATVRLQTVRTDANESALISLYASASNRFVPREFLDQLGRKTLADVRLGDHVAADMTVFFSDIRDFTRLSETMTPQQNFDFLNSYLKRATPIVRAHHGFIDKYIGDAIMALFAREPADALEAAVALQRELVRYNQGRAKAGYEPIRVGIGLHCGALILGTIGEEERIQTTVISDVVNDASRIEGLTKRLGTPLLVSGAVVARLSSGHGFHLRPLGAVKAKGKQSNVEIFECYDADPDELRQHKTNNVELFARAVEEYRSGRILSAQKTFSRVAQQNVDDVPAMYFRESCTRAVLHDRPKGAWDASEGPELVEF